MSDREALLRAIVAAREEDTPRLAFADWLDEHGNEDDRLRAEFIRVQIALLRLDAHSRAWRQAEARHKELADLRRRWVPLELADCPLYRVYEFERGFVGHIQVYVQARIEGLPGTPITHRYADFADGWFAAAPITSVGLFRDGLGSDGSIRGLLEHPTFRHVRRFDLTDCPLRTAEVRRLADAPNATGLRELVLTGSGIDSQSVRTLARRSGFTDLARLDLSRTQHVAPDALTELLDSARLGRLTDLNLGTNPHLGDETAALVAGSLVAPRLKRLNLSGCSIGPVGVRALLEDDRLARLESLVLSAGGNLPRAGTAAARAVARCRALVGLRELHLARQGIEDEGAVALARSPHLTSLRRLDLTGNHIGPPGLAALARAPFARGLYWLNLRYNNLVAADLDGVRDQFSPDTEIRV
jgi:uncharacterized protein (TIGR02996 family)